jgi:hypothetical protein
MNRKLWLLLLIVATPLSAHGLDFVLQLQSPWPGLSAGPSPVISGPEDYKNSDPFLLPVEGKFLAIRFGAFAMSFNTGTSIYFENHSFSSINVSGGISFL